MPPGTETVALLLTHRSTIATDRAALRFINQGLGASRTTVLFDEAPGNAPSAGLAPFVSTFDSRQLASWGYGTIGDPLIAGHPQFPPLRYFEQHPHFDWCWWHTLQSPAECTVVSEPLRALLVVARYSRRALETFSRYCRSGWQGHAEVLAPTAMKQAGLTIADIGGHGPFTPGTRVEAVIRSCRQHLAWRRAKDGVAEAELALQNTHGRGD
jgi:hypothetical protein